MNSSLSSKNTISKKFSNIIRNCVAKYLTGNLGKVVEEDEKIICYVKKSRCKKEKYQYIIACFGIRDKNKELAEKYHLNKPICYVIDGIHFDEDQVKIFGYDNCEVIIKNCTFNMGLYIRIIGKCTLENTFIRELDRLLIGANELLIKNMDIRNQIKFIEHHKYTISVYAEKLEINNSYIGKTKENTKVTIIAPKQIEIYNSKIAGDVVECESQKLISGKKSTIEATEKVDLQINEYYQINITSPIINYNGNTIDTENKPVTLKRTKDAQEIKRFQLIEYLKKIKNQCEEINQQKVDEYSDSLSNERISRVLKK